MASQQLLPLWRYHGVRLLRSTSTWVMLALIVAMAGTQGVMSSHLPEIMSSLAGPEMTELLAATMPEPSWHHAYAGWMKNLAQIITLGLLTINALGYAQLSSNGDIPFILTKNLRRSYYLATGAISTWCAIFAYAAIGATVTWAGTALVFSDAPYLPVLVASLVWGLEMTLISAVQLLATTLKPGIGAPVLAGVGLYLLIAIGGTFDRIAAYSPLGLSRLSTEISSQDAVGAWLIPVGSSLGLVLVVFLWGICRFNRCELA
ncbi:ABC transporter permease [Corynebacterium sp. TAE3-ERU30]|uniref:ABC transporter permease n=1 Tax=Corynebacterium sp. TAE3-ERU30 TaxID=2849496 RepID=UPI001C466C6F|nr:ABC transporter permease [Corynebacterium sp. TAE3-ERU30]MBV7282449.1 ABC transporter permease [Corynebacterium sp. TAE3-ERU30]